MRVKAAGKYINHRQNGAFPRYVQRVARVPIAGDDGVRQALRGEFGKILSRVAQPLEELSDDCTGISPGIVEQLIGESGQKVTHLMAAGLQQCVECCAQRQAQVGTGVAIGNGKNIDSVQQLLLPDYAMNAGTQPGRQLTDAQGKLRCRVGRQTGRYSRGSRKRVPI